MPTPSLGLIARCEVGLSRGLAAQTHTFYTHLNPTRTLLIVMEGEQAAYPQDPSQYPGPNVVVVRQSELTEGIFRSFAKGLDVVMSCETFYHPEAPAYMRSVGCRSILQFNREFLYHPSRPPAEQPDLYISPSTWDLDHWPPGTIHLPTPIDRQKFPFTLRESASTFLHIAGHRALGDRAGTELVAQASMLLPRELRLVIRSQSKIHEDRFTRATCTTDIIHANLPTAQSLYSIGDVLVAPRRYGGGSLVFDQAASLGLPIIALYRQPESDILPPSCLVKSNEWTALPMPAGQITLYQCRPIDLANRILAFHSSPTLVQEASLASDRFAESISWPILLPRWQSVFSTLAER